MSTERIIETTVEGVPVRFTTPPERVQAARVALAQVDLALHEGTDPLEYNADLTGIGFAVSALEEVNPVYAPLPVITASPDPRGDLRAARGALLTEIERTDTAVDKLRYARVVHEINDLDLAADLTSPPPAGDGDTTPT